MFGVTIWDNFLPPLISVANCFLVENFSSLKMSPKCQNIISKLGLSFLRPLTMLFAKASSRTSRGCLSFVKSERSKCETRIHHVCQVLESLQKYLPLHLSTISERIVFTARNHRLPFFESSLLGFNELFACSSLFMRVQKLSVASSTTVISFPFRFSYTVGFGAEL